MDFGERKRKILSVIIEKYIESGVPIGSKTVCEALDISISSATVRNEMAELSGLGYLNQPHTSAGRTPSYLGYELYVNRLMKNDGVSEEEKNFINGVLCEAADDPEHLLRKAANLLAEITNLTSILTTPPNDEARVKNIRFIITGKRNAMLVLMTTTGMVQNRLFRCKYNLTDELVDAFENVVNEKFKGKLLRDLTSTSINTLAALESDMFLLMSPVLNALTEAAQEALEVKVKTDGEANLLTNPEFTPPDILNILEFLRNRDGILKVLFFRERGVNIFIGGSDLYPGLEATSIITSRYSVGERSGAIGVIGATRADYKRLISKIKYLSDEVGRWLERILEIDV